MVHHNNAFFNAILNQNHSLLEASLIDTRDNDFNSAEE